MIVTELLDGQGLGNQLWCYAVTRTIALDRGFDFGIMSPDKFKGSEFMNIDFGREDMSGVTTYYKEKRVIHSVSNSDISPMDKDMTMVPDNTNIEGVMQSEDYIIHRKDEVIDWLTIDKGKDIKDFSSDNICVIHFRGGDFMGAETTLLPPAYYRNAMKKMREENNDAKFVIATDDIDLARQYFPDIGIVGASTIGVPDSRKAGHHIGGPIWMDYSIIKNAKYLILSNSSFGWWAAWTNTVSNKIIAPKYWARYNISDGYWSNGDSLTRGWFWLDRTGNLFDYDECLREKRRRYV